MENIENIEKESLRKAISEGKDRLLKNRRLIQLSGNCKTPIQLAVDEGLIDKIYGRPTTQEERQAWLDEECKNCFDDYTWFQEYCCIAIDEACAFLPYELIATCEMQDVLKSHDTACISQKNVCALFFFRFF